MKKKIIFAILCVTFIYWLIPNKAWVFGTHSVFDSVRARGDVIVAAARQTIKIRAAWGLQQKIFVRPTQEEPCIMYGLGIAEDLTFETVMKNEGCDVYAFDCTSPPYMAQRARDAGIHFYPWCIGKYKAFTGDNGYIQHSDPKQLTVFKPLDNVMKTLKHTYVSLLKMDIEGFEWGVFETLLSHKDTVVWPDQLAFELHLEGTNPKAVNPEVVKGKGEWEMMRLFENLKSVGYTVVFKQLNPGDPYCCEFTLVR